MLNGAGDAHRYVQLRRDDFAGLADLIVVRGVACIHCRAGGADGGERIGQLINQLKVFRTAEARPPDTTILAAVNSGRSLYREARTHETRFECWRYQR